MTGGGEKPSGAKLNLPRDLQMGYVLGRMGTATVGDLWPMFYGAQSTARFGFLRLRRLNIVSAFAADDPSRPTWFSLSRGGLAWVVEEVGCNEAELRRYSGLSHVNLGAIKLRNRLWVSLVLASRKSSLVRLALFRPEWELRRLKAASQALVPDALFVLELKEPAAGELRGPGTAHSQCCMVELDSGSERGAVWLDKARAYTAARSAGPLYGESTWQLLVLIPSVKRARSVAQALVKGGAGPFSFLALSSTLDEGRALEPLLWRARELVEHQDVPPTHSLVDGFTKSHIPLSGKLRAELPHEGR
jgi:hypothetical protein